MLKRKSSVIITFFLFGLWNILKRWGAFSQTMNVTLSCPLNPDHLKKFLALYPTFDLWDRCLSPHGAVRCTLTYKGQSDWGTLLKHKWHRHHEHYASLIIEKCSYVYRAVYSKYCIIFPQCFFFFFLKHLTWKIPGCVKLVSRID